MKNNCFLYLLLQVQFAQLTTSAGSQEPGSPIVFSSQYNRHSVEAHHRALPRQNMLLQTGVNNERYSLSAEKELRKFVTRGSLDHIQNEPVWNLRGTGQTQKKAHHGSLSGKEILASLFESTLPSSSPLHVPEKVVRVLQGGKTSAPTFSPVPSKCIIDDTGSYGLQDGDQTVVYYTWEVATTTLVAKDEVDELIVNPTETQLANLLIPSMFPKACGQTRRLRYLQQTEADSGLYVGISSRPLDFLLEEVECSATNVRPCYVISGAMTVYSENKSQDIVWTQIQNAIKRVANSTQLVSAVPEAILVIALDDTAAIAPPTEVPTPLSSPTSDNLTSLDVSTWNSSNWTVTTDTLAPASQGDSDDDIQRPIHGLETVPVWAWLLVAAGVCVCCTYVDPDGYEDEIIIKR